MKTRSCLILLLSFFVLATFNQCDKDDNNDNNDNNNNPPANNPPVAAFTINPTGGTPATVFNFDASASTDQEDNLSDLKFRWDFDGDGNWDTQYLTSPTTIHQYTAAGTYTVMLEVTDTGLESGTVTNTVTVTENGNNPPSVPSNPSPADGATEQALSLVLSWVCNDPDQDLLTYDVYFGTTQPLGIVQQGNTASYNPGQLQESATYFWKIVARDDKNLETEGPVWSFTTQGSAPFQCGDVFTDPRNGETYNTILVNGPSVTQCWMAKNINIGNMIGGNNPQTDNDVIEKYCYDNNETNCETFGGLYQWDELMQYTSNEEAQGICPDGWHVASDMEWQYLEEAIGMPFTEIVEFGLRGTNEAIHLKPGGSTGFDALFNGYRNNGGGFLNLNTYATFATSTESNLNLAYVRYLFLDNDQIFRDKNNEKTFGLGVRCIQD